MGSVRCIGESRRLGKFDVEVYSSGATNLAQANFQFTLLESSSGANAVGSRLDFVSQPATVVLSSYTGTRHYQSPTNLTAYLPDNVSWREDETVHWINDMGGGWSYAAENNHNGVNDLNISSGQYVISADGKTISFPDYGFFDIQPWFQMRLA